MPTRSEKHTVYRTIIKPNLQSHTVRLVPLDVYLWIKYKRVLKTFSQFINVGHKECVGKQTCVINNRAIKNHTRRWCTQVQHSGRSLTGYREVRQARAQPPYHLDRPFRCGIIDTYINIITKRWEWKLRHLHITTQHFAPDDQSRPNWGGS